MANDPHPVNPPGDPIEHVIVLMLENHSFDQMLGCFKQVYPQLEGVDPSNPAVNYDTADQPFAQAPVTDRQMRFDPRHDLANVSRQLMDGNSGFVLDFTTYYPESTAADRRALMGYYPLDFLPALHRLARDFTICDRWFASVPGPTWPNRFFALSGTSLGRVAMPENVEHLNLHVYNQTTVFDRLNEAAVSWKVYYHDIPQSLVLAHQLDAVNAARYFPVDDFFRDARGSAGDFPQFCFIEPRYNGTDQNDDHPPHDVMRAQKLIADVYNAVRGNAELWSSALLVIVYDEHGGFYDHVPPPAAVPPDEHAEEYRFDRLGVRVPALLISPWVERAVVQTVFDHTSLLKYLSEKWALGPLGNRVKVAASIGAAIRKTGVARTDTVESIQLSAEQLRSPDPGLEVAAAGSPTALQQALIAFGHLLAATADEEAPRVLSAWARLMLQLRAAWAWIGGHFARQPEAFVVAQVHVPRFLKVQREKATRQLAAKIADPTTKQPERKKAAKALRTITGKDGSGQ
jgi:phospholipase C